MEVELEPRVRPLAYKVKAVSRETTTQKAMNLLESDLRTHWSTGTNNKEWILLELDVPCLLSHLRIYNKSVLEWEFAVGLRYKPETFVKVRPRCEAPRREINYPMNYTPCRYVRISCLRGNPIAIFFIQLIGISMAGLEPEFQPVVNYLLPDIISHKQDPHDIFLQLLQDVTNRLNEFIPQLETDLINFPESAESNICFLAMLIGPFYPILLVLKEWKTEKDSLSCSDSDVSKNKLTSNFSVSSNFEAAPRRSSPSPLFKPTSCSIAFRLENVFMLLRKAHRDSSLGTVCRVASRTLQKLVGPITSVEDSIPPGDSVADINDDGAKTDSLQNLNLTDYSGLFGEEFKIPDDCWDASFVNLVDIASIEEAILHVLYCCASQPCLCDKLADNISGFWSVLPLIQALLPALRPIHGYLDQVDDSFSQWDNPFSHRALSQITSSLSSSALHSVLCASAGYLSSFFPSHAKAACVLMDLCSGPLAPWIPTVIVKVDLAIELLEDLLPAIQCASQCIGHACAALKYIILALSGHMDDILPKFKEVKHKILFLVEMLNPFLNPAVTATRNTLAFGDVSALFMEEEEQNCSITLNIIRSAVQRPGVLSSLESEWRRGSVAPSVLLSVLGPHLPLPPEIDLCKFSVSKGTEQDTSPALSDFSVIDHMPPSKSSFVEGFDGKCDSTGAVVKMDENEDANMLFAPPELKNMMLISSKVKSSSPKEKHHNQNVSVDQIQNCLTLKTEISIEYYNMQADYLQLANLEDCKSRASEFQHLAFDLYSQDKITQEGHEAAVDALLLAAECYINPVFLLSFRNLPKHLAQTNTHGTIYEKNKIVELGKEFKKNTKDLGTMSFLEKKRDKVVLEILLQAADFDRRYRGNAAQEFPCIIESTGGTELSDVDMQAADAITLVRKNQALLCHFLIQRLLNEHQMLHEVLLQSLLFYLCSATALYCPPENIIDVIIQSAENLSKMLTYSYHQLKESNGKLDHEMLHGIQRHWMLLQKLVMASSGNDSVTQSKNMVYGFQYGRLIPISAWIFRISKISVSSSPLARFLGWMALSQYTKQYLKQRLFISFDLSQITSLLSIFKDELSIVDNVANQNAELPQLKCLEAKTFDEGTSQCDCPNHKDSFGVEHPDLQKFFPDMKLQFGTFSEYILEAVGLQLKSLPSIAVSEALCWFSEFCMSPFSEYECENVSFASTTNHLKGHTRKNAKAIVLYLLEAITYEHMEAMIPEMPRVAQILVSLCKSSYCDVAFLDSVLHVLKPLISYALRKASFGENILIDDSLHDYEALCFGVLFSYIKCKNGSDDTSIKNICQGPLIIFTLGALFPDLSLPRKQEILKSLSLWADFTSEPTSFFDYLSAFQSIIDGFVQLLIRFLRVFGVEIPQFEPQVNVKTMFTLEGNLGASTNKLNNPQRNSFLSTIEMPEGGFDDFGFSFEKTSHLSPTDIEDISQSFSDLVSKLFHAIEFCWELHFQLALKLTLTSAKCCLLLRCLMSICHVHADIVDKDRDAFADVAVDSDKGSTHWKEALQELTVTIIGIQQNHCWQVASAMLDYLLGLPEVFSLDHVGSSICVSLKNFCCHAPRISWRLQTDKWLSTLSRRSFIQFIRNCSSLGDLFCVMLGHSEPEQRCIALHYLGKLVGLDVDDGITKRLYMLRQDSILTEDVLSTSQEALLNLVSVTWDKVVALALSDPLFLIRANSMVLLSGYIPFADRHQLQSFLVTTHITFPGIGTCVSPLQDPLVHHSLGLLAFACLYSPIEDISLIPESVWRNLDNMRASKSVLDDLEKKICQALFELRAQAENGKEILKETLSSGFAVKQTDPEFRCIRESILQVLSSLTSARSYFDFFSKKVNQEDQELEEAEIELELLQKDKALLDSSGSQEEAPPVSILSYNSDGNNNRLNKLKDEIRELERCKLREEIVARRQKKLLASHIRQKQLEELALREVELLQELDREKNSEAEREIQRQRLLEAERSKTRELRHNLDVEREKQTQRELQKELEQAESGAQTRKEFSSNPSGRPRERHRDRENGRSSHEGSMRPSNRGHEGQPPTILQSRDRSDERVGSYEDSFDGSRDPGDAGSVGEPETGLAYDNPTGGYGSVPRQGSRGSRSRHQIIERREREGTRGGKWERKHT